MFYPKTTWLDAFFKTTFLSLATSAGIEPAKYAGQNGGPYHLATRQIADSVILVR